MPLDDPQPALNLAPPVAPSQAQLGAETAGQQQLTGLKVREAQIALNQQNLQIQRQQAFRQAIAEAGRNPSSLAYTRVSALFPEYAEELKTSVGQYSAQEKANATSELLPAYFALQNNRPDVAMQHLQKLRAGYENSGFTAKAAGAQAAIDAIQSGGDLNHVAGILGGYLNETMGEKEFEGTLKAHGHHAEQRKNEALAQGEEATTAAKIDPATGLLAQQKQTIATGAAAETASRAQTEKLGVETRAAQNPLTGLAAQNKALIEEKQTAAEASRAATKKTLGLLPSDIVKGQAEAMAAEAAANVASATTPTQIQEILDKARITKGTADNAADFQKALATEKAAQAKLAALTAANAPEKQAAELKGLAASTDLATQQAERIKKMLPGEIKKQESEDDRIGAETAKLRLEAGRLPDKLQEPMEKAATQSAAQHRLSLQALELAYQFREGVTGAAASGGLARLAAAAKHIFGNENKVDLLRQRYMQIKNSILAKSFGSTIALNRPNATIVDMAKEANPDKFTDPEVMAQSLEKLAYGASWDAHTQNAFMEHVGQNRDMGNALKDFEADGRKVHKDDTLGAFLSSVNGPTKRFTQIQQGLRELQNPNSKLSPASREKVKAALRAEGLEGI